MFIGDDLQSRLARDNAYVFGDMQRCLTTSNATQVVVVYTLDATFIREAYNRDLLEIGRVSLVSDMQHCLMTDNVIRVVDGRYT